MKLYPKRLKGGYITGYFVLLGSKEARDAGFVRPDGTTAEVQKTVDQENHRIVIELAEAEASVTE